MHKRAPKQYGSYENFWLRREMDLEETQKSGFSVWTRINILENCILNRIQENMNAIKTDIESH